MLKREVSALLVNPPRPHSAPLSRRGIVLSHVDRESAFRRRRAMRALPEDSPGKSRVAQDIRMMVVELRAVELPVEEIVLYLEKSVKLPDGTTGQALAQCFTDVNSLVSG